MSAEAYRRVQKTAESPRETEYRVFAQVTAALIKARDTQAQGADLVSALDWNRRIAGERTRADDLRILGRAFFGG